MSTNMKRTVLVTGSANGIGAATAHYLREHGHTVIGLDLAGATISCDLSTPEGRATAVAETIAHCGGKLDAIISCAGVAGANTDAMIGVNYFGTIALTIGHQDATLAYASTKLALGRWIRQTAKLPEWAGQGILLNGIAPGTVVTNMTKPILASEEGRAMLALVTPIAVPAYAQPDDIAPLLAFLASDECHYMVGQIIFIDGGKDVILRGDDIFQG